jgi:two-component system, NtrC family, sensor kinase
MASPPHVNHRPSVLVVDDEPLILKIVASILTPEHDVTCEPRADAVLGRIREGQRFDVILCDLMMPHMTGMELHDALLEIAPDQAKVMVFVTGGAFTSRAREFLDRVPNSTIEKPFNSANLLTSVREVIR